jgi:hypothetical protein
VNEILDQFLSNPLVTTAATAAGVALVALWIAAAWWTYSDAARRTDSVLAALLASAWIIVSTPLLFPLALVIYALVRPQQSAAEHRTKRIARELVAVLDELAPPACLSCGNEVDPAWQRCPTCTTWLSLPCAACGTWSDRSLAVCPFCGNEERAEPIVEPLEPAFGATPRRRARRQARAVGPGLLKAPRAARRALVSDDQAPVAARAR